jgi:hypothetical protein
MKIKLLAFLLFSYCSVHAQNAMQFFRPYDETGLHMFETTKTDTTAFKKLYVQIGGSFEQTFQTLRDKNTAIYFTKPGYAGNVNSLIPLTNGFNLAMANLNIDAQLSDGIRVNLTAYLSSRHHEDTWVKGGYIQFDKLLFLHSDAVDNIMKSVTIKIGQFDLDYGDQHFRRTDGGSTLYNPFVENYIMDEFATEIGAEFYYHHKSGLFAMAGISNGELDPTVVAPTKTDSASGQINHYDPAYHFKLGFDKQINSDFRFRLTGSYYTVHSTNNNTLFGGDRTGSHYFSVMENQNIANGTTISNENDYSPFSGRFNPGFTQQVNTFMINPFIKYKGLEFFATYENAQGRTISEFYMRKAVQYSADLIYRFPARNENFWIGVRYNTVTSAVQNLSQEITINREVASAGWFLTRNIMLKVEYVNQEYKNYPGNNILSGGKFYGTLFEAAIAF